MGMETRPQSPRYQLPSKCKENKVMHVKTRDASLKQITHFVWYCLFQEKIKNNNLYCNA